MKIFLIGFMGCGKTYWGSQWAKQHGLQFYDLDAEIEVDQQKSVREIFEEKGEEYFRARETDLLHKISLEDNFLLACGGGTPCCNNNIEMMNNEGVTVYLDASPDYIYSRLKNETAKRPLINILSEEEMLPFITQKLSERENCYSKATFHLKAGEVNLKSLLTLFS